MIGDRENSIIFCTFFCAIKQNSLEMFSKCDVTSHLQKVNFEHNEIKNKDKPTSYKQNC